MNKIHFYCFCKTVFSVINLIWAWVIKLFLSVYIIQKKEKSRTKINAVSPVGEGKFFILNKEYSICVIWFTQEDISHLKEAYSFSDYNKRVYEREKWTCLKRYDTKNLTRKNEYKLVKINKWHSLSKRKVK